MGYDDGAFELCLPSLGFFLTKLTLRCRFWAFVDRMTRVWGEGHRGHGSHDYAVLAGSLEVYAVEPVGGNDA